MSSNLLDPDAVAYTLLIGKTPQRQAELLLNELSRRAAHSAGPKTDAVADTVKATILDQGGITRQLIWELWKRGYTFSREYLEENGLLVQMTSVVKEEMSGDCEKRTKEV